MGKTGYAFDNSKTGTHGNKMEQVGSDKRKKYMAGYDNIGWVWNYRIGNTCQGL